MGQMAAKRTKQASGLHMNLYLGVAVRVVLWHGKAIFEAEALQQERERLGGWMQEAFPGDQFDFWESEKGLSDKRLFEADALLEALRELMEGQVHRLQHSGSLVANPLLRFRQLYRQALLRRVSEHKVLPSWRLAGHREADSERRAFEFWEQALHDGEEDESGAHNSDAAMLTDEQPLLSDPEQVDVVAEKLRKRVMAFLVSLGRVQRAEGFPGGELRAVYEAIKAIYRGARYPLGALRRNALSQHLSEAQLRALRRACARYDQIVPFLTDLSTWIANVGKWLPKRGSQPTEGMRRRRVGRIFLDMAEQAEQGGYTRAAAGLRARNKWEWGKHLTEEEHELMTKDAAEWVLRVYRPSLLANLPDEHEEFARILQEDSAAAAAEFARQALGFAIAFWPQGAAASFPSESTG